MSWRLCVSAIRQLCRHDNVVQWHWYVFTHEWKVLCSVAYAFFLFLLILTHSHESNRFINNYVSFIMSVCVCGRHTALVCNSLAVDVRGLRRILCTQSKSGRFDEHVAWECYVSCGTVAYRKTHWINLIYVELWRLQCGMASSVWGLCAHDCTRHEVHAIICFTLSFSVLCLFLSNRRKTTCSNVLKRGVWCGFAFFVAVSWGLRAGY